MSTVGQKVCIIIPAFNEEHSLQGVIESIRYYAPDADLVVVNDASTDATSTIARRLDVPVLELPINLGIGGAMQTGFKYARRRGYDIAMQLDGDGQHDPKHMAQVLEPLRRGKADMVIGSRFLTPVGYTSSFLRLFGIRFFAWLIGMMTNRRIFDATSGYRAYNKQALAFASQNYPSDFPEPESIVQFLRNGFRIKEVSVAMRSRQGGVSSVRFSKGIYFVASNTLAIIITTFKRKVRL
jgi:glycosyltransferase involved in cell wall biosynthesis